MRPLYHLWAAGKSRVQSHRLKIYIFIGWMNNFGHSPKKIMFAFRRLKKMFRRKCFFRVFFDQLLLNGNQYRDLFCRTTATTTTTTAITTQCHLSKTATVSFWSRWQASWLSVLSKGPLLKMQLFWSGFESRPWHQVVRKINPSCIICEARHGNKCVVWKFVAKKKSLAEVVSQVVEHWTGIGKARVHILSVCYFSF